MTLFMTLMAAFATLLHRYSGQTDVVIGSPIAHRTRREIEDVVGCFINTLALRTDLTGDPVFTDLLPRVKETCLQAFAHQDLPFEKLVEALQPQRDLSHSPIFQAMLILHVQDTRKISTLGGRPLITPVEVHTPTSKFDLTLELTEVDRRAAGLAGVQHRSLRRRRDGAAGRDHFQTLLGGIVADPGRTVGELPLAVRRGADPAARWSGTPPPQDYPSVRPACTGSSRSRPNGRRSRRAVAGAVTARSPTAS